MAKEWRTKIYVTYSRWRTPTFNSYTTHRQYKFAFLSHLLFSMHFIHKLKTNVALHLCIFFGNTKLPHTDYKSWCQNIRNVYIMTIILNGGFTIALLFRIIHMCKTFMIMGWSYFVWAWLSIKIKINNSSDPIYAIYNLLTAWGFL